MSETLSISSSTLDNLKDDKDTLLFYQLKDNNTSSISKSQNNIHSSIGEIISENRTHDPISSDYDIKVNGEDAPILEIRN